MAEKKAIVKQLRGIALAGKGDSNHWVAMDGDPSFGGTQAASSPTELVLIALGGCTLMDVIAVLGKKRSRFANVEVRLTAKTAEEHPKVFTEVHIEYLVFGDSVRREDVERAIELSTTRYCPVSAMLQPSVKVSHSYKLVPERETATPAGETAGTPPVELRPG